jgi:predicted RNase H-like HicB family nuclease
MEHVVNIHIERLPEGLYVATSEEVQGLVAQGRTLAETLEIARDVARRLLEAQAERHPAPDKCYADFRTLGPGDVTSLSSWRF